MPQRDDRDFPVRLRVRIPAEEYASAILVLSPWLDKHTGWGRWAWHSIGPTVGGDMYFFYFQHSDDAGDFLKAFNSFQLADAIVGRDAPRAPLTDSLTER